MSSPKLLFALVAALAFGFASVGNSQSLDAGQQQLQQQLQQQPPPLVIAGIPVAARNPDLSHYDLVERCGAAFDRTLHAVGLKISSDSFRLDDPMTSFPTTAIQTGRQCLNHFRADAVPVYSLPFTLQLAVAVNADTLLREIVTRQLALAKNTQERAVVLGATIELLMSNQSENAVDAGRNWNDWHFTAAHIQLSREYLNRLDELGAVALVQRIQGRQAILRPSEYTNDVAAQLSGWRDIQQLIQRAQRDSLPRDSVRMKTLKEQLSKTDLRIAVLTYLQSPSHDNLAGFVTAREKWMINLIGRSVRDLTDTPAPPIIGDYWFNTAKGGHTAVPTPGVINVLWFEGQERGSVCEDGVRCEAYAQLRRIHQAFPDVAITVVTSTNGFFRQQVFTDHPDQEAEFRYHYFADSLGVPGVVCVIKGQFHAVQGGHIAPAPLAVWEAYQLSLEATKFVIVDPTGIIVDDGERRPFNGDDMVDFIRRLHIQFPAVTR